MDFLIMKEIEGFEGYFVDEEGNVYGNRKCRKNLNCELRQLKPFLDKDGYVKVSLHKQQKQRTKSVHRLVAQSFILNPENKPQVNHINGIKTDNRVENLEWSTAKENIQHAENKGLRESKGEKNRRAKLTEVQVLLIREDSRTQHKIAAEYGVSQSIIGFIKTRKTWKHI